MALLDTVARNIRAVRVESGLTQEELARKAGLSLAYVSKLERGLGNLTIPTLEKIADVLGVQAATLFGSGDAKLVLQKMPAGLRKDLEEVVKILQKNLSEKIPNKRRQ